MNKKVTPNGLLLTDVRSHKPAIALAGLLWLFLFMTTMSKTWFWQVRNGLEIEYGFIILRALLIWGYAVVFVPIVYWLSTKFPLDGRPWPTVRNAIVHIFLCLLLLPIYVLLYRASIILIYLPDDFFASLFYYQALMQIIVDLGVVFICVYGLVVISVHLRWFYHRYRARLHTNAELEAELASANLNVLKNQLRPHFLFNTLHNINALIHEDSKAAANMLSLLQRLLTQSFFQSSHQTVSLEKELEFTGVYLEIENIRFNDRLNVQLDIDSATLNARVPSLILQPLAENAVRHGISKKMSAGTIYITSKRIEQNLQLIVEDDGPGLPDGQNHYGNGIGLKNTRERLRHTYNDHQFVLSTSDHGGLRVFIEIPFASELSNIKKF